MMYIFRRKGFKWLHPVLRKLTHYYLSKPRWYTFENIKIKIEPGVFHPGLFFSSGFLIAYLKTLDLQGRKILELGAGSGLISIFCAGKGAQVTSTDISKVAVGTIKDNADRLNVSLEIIESDLFEKLEQRSFDYIIINPPYYPRKAHTHAEMAWYCGQEFEYFQALFDQLGDFTSATILMVLSEDCDLDRIESIAANNRLALELVASKKFPVEENYIFQISPK